MQLFTFLQVITDMKNVKRLEDVPVVNKLVKLEFLWDWLVLLLAIVIQVTLTPKLTATPCVDFLC